MPTGRLCGLCRDMQFTLDSQHFPSGKDYACIRDENGTKTFLRNIAFLHAPRNPHKIVVVHEWGYPMDHEWEPPKGQMEWKELKAAGHRRGAKVDGAELWKAMRDGVRREILEEAKIPARALQNLHVLPVSYTAPFKEAVGVAGAGAQFRYQFWTAEVTAATVAAAQKELGRIVGNPAVQARLAADKKEKDAVGFWEPHGHADWGKIRGAFSGAMTRMYYEWLRGRMDNRRKD